MRVLIACEESQTVCKAFRKRGFEAYSCDIQEQSGGHPEWHIKGDVLEVINDGWDLIIAHPPCTHLAVSGARWFKEGVKPRYLQDESADFFMKFVNANAKFIAVENPICIMSTRYRKPDQIINPFQFGHPEQKKTCLWLKGLPKLAETNNVYDYMMTLPIKERTRIHWLGSNKSKERSKTYEGIAEAMAQQWGDFLLNQSK
jgi:site-specific DNA-cytosine methylase